MEKEPLVITVGRAVGWKDESLQLGRGMQSKLRYSSRECGTHTASYNQLKMDKTVIKGVSKTE